MKAVVVAVLLAGCGTDPVRIDLAMPGTQVLVTEKVNSGPWQKLSGQFDGETNKTTYSVEIGDEYELVAVCLRSGPTDAGQFDAAQLFGTAEDAEVTLGSWEVPNCLRSGSGIDPSDTRVTLTGTFDETMDLAVGGPIIHVTAGHVFAFTTDAGRHDLVAYSNTKLLIQRDVPLTADGTLEPVHVASDGTSMLSAVVDLPTDVDEASPDIANLLTTRSGTHFSWWPEDPSGALFVPTSMLGAGDIQTLSAYIYSKTGARGIAVEDGTRLADATLLPRIASSTFHAGGFGVTWSPISEFYTTASVSARPTTDSWQSVTASRLWLERHGNSSLDFDPAIDGYDPSWMAFATRLTLTRWSPGIESSTSSDLVGGM